MTGVRTPGNVHYMETTTTATVTAGTWTIGPEQLPRTVTVGDVVKVISITTDGRFAYVSAKRCTGYVAVTALSELA